MGNQADQPDGSSSMPEEVTVQLFAGMAELAGRRQIRIQPQPATVAGIRASLIAAMPEIESLLERSMVAVNGRYAESDEAVEVTAEVAVIPPVSGG
jgi:molybdopterin converting factor subunit 1